MKNKTAPPGFTRFFRFAGLLPIGAGFAKRNDGPQCPPQAKKIGIWGAFYTKNTSPPGGSAPAAGGKFLGIWGRCTQKSRCWDAFRNVFLAQNTPQISKFPPPAGQTPKCSRITPPLVAKSGITRGGFFSNVWPDFRIFGKNTPKNFRRFAAKKTQHQWF